MVGFKVRFNDEPAARRLGQADDRRHPARRDAEPIRCFTQYDTLIIDEAHERSLNIDFLLGYLKQLLPRRPDLKADHHFGDDRCRALRAAFRTSDEPAPVIEVSGRLYPVEVRYRPVADVDDADDRDADGCARRRGRRAVPRAGPGDVLVFLPGEREIRETAEALRKHSSGRPSRSCRCTRGSRQKSRNGSSSPDHGRRVVLATNVAETSLTVPGIRYVVDPGLARVKRYSYRNKVEQLQIEPICQAAANQRAGRCGRVADGICIRLYGEEDFLKRPRSPIRRSCAHRSPASSCR